MTLQALLERSIEQCIERSTERSNRKTAFSGTIAFDEPMSQHTTFKIGPLIFLAIDDIPKERVEMLKFYI
jgi:hypothetical protein